MKLSSQYYDAILSGDKESAERIKVELDSQTKLAQKYTGISPIAINTVLGNDETPAITVYNFLNAKFNDDWHDWEIETIEKMLWIEYGLKMSDSMADKVQAIKLILNSQRPYLDWYYFNNVACAMTGAIADFTNIKSPSPGMTIATVKAMRAIRPEEVFSRDVKKYIALVMIHEGIYCPPPSLMDLISDEFEVSKEQKDMWPAIMKKLLEKDYEESDDTISIQARRIMVAEKAAEKFGG